MDVTETRSGSAARAAVPGGCAAASRVLTGGSAAATRRSALASVSCGSRCTARAGGGRDGARARCPGHPRRAGAGGAFRRRATMLRDFGARRVRYTAAVFGCEVRRTIVIVVAGRYAAVVRRPIGVAAHRHAITPRIVQSN